MAFKQRGRLAKAANGFDAEVFAKASCTSPRSISVAVMHACVQRWTSSCQSLMPCRKEGEKNELIQNQSRGKLYCLYELGKYARIGQSCMREKNSLLKLLKTVLLALKIMIYLHTCMSRDLHMHFGFFGSTCLLGEWQDPSSESLFCFR